MSYYGYDDVDQWGEALEQWRRDHWKLQREANAAWDKRSQDEDRARRLRKDAEAAKAEYEKSDAAARDIQARLDKMRKDGEERRFRP